MKNIRYTIRIILVLVMIILSYMLYKQVSENNDIANTTVYEKNNGNNEQEINVYARLPIFMYHNVSDNTGTDKYVGNYLSPSKLEEQLKYIHDNNYQTIFVDQLANLSNYEKPVALTFDDGYENFYENAYPILQKYNEKATLNVITQFIDKANYVTSEQIREMEESGLVSIESHTQRHPDLTKISDISLTNELKSSQEDLKNMFNTDSTVICYPSGRNNQNVIEKASQYYKYGLTTKNSVYDSKIDDLFKIPRVRISREITMKSYIYYLKMSEVTRM